MISFKPIPPSCISGSHARSIINRRFFQDTIIPGKSEPFPIKKLNRLSPEGRPFPRTLSRSIEFYLLYT
uniref:Uncharacterized protein n=1 Tax=Picea glauca TaxID=3330 RepID=A0A101LU62_PICGL|nr:hypothetical protein ABT39_MTgene2698 [Picea glauca]